MKLSNILFEGKTYRLYHGSRHDFDGFVLPEKTSQRGRGIFFSNSTRYAGGSRVVHIFDIDKDIVHTNDPRAELNLEEVIQFLEGVKPLPKRDLIISDLRRYSKRRGNTEQIPADVLK